MEKYLRSAIYLALLILSQTYVLNVSASEAPSLKGMNLMTSKEVVASADGKKGLVVVFLSAVCPCSNSHIVELKSLSADYPQFNFVAVHSNTDESKEVTKAYFEKANLPFPVIQDNKAKIADQYKALKTPHAFVLSAGGQILYRGGVSDSHEFKDANKKYLRDALADIQNNKMMATSEGRTLGCVISRNGSNVW